MSERPRLWWLPYVFVGGAVVAVAFWWEQFSDLVIDPVLTFFDRVLFFAGTTPGWAYWITASIALAVIGITSIARTFRGTGFGPRKRKVPKVLDLSLARRIEHVIGVGSLNQQLGEHLAGLVLLSLGYPKYSRKSLEEVARSGRVPPEALEYVMLCLDPSLRDPQDRDRSGTVRRSLTACLEYLETATGANA